MDNKLVYVKAEEYTEENAMKTYYLMSVRGDGMEPKADMPEKEALGLISHFIRRIHPEIPAHLVDAATLLHAPTYIRYYNVSLERVSGNKFVMNEVSCNGKNTQVCFEIMEVEYSRAVFMVVENFLSPFEGIPSIKRLWHEPFRVFKEAAEYVQNEKTHNSGNESVWEIHIADRDEIMETEWYKEQMEAVRLMKEAGTSPYGPEFCIDTGRHLKSLKQLMEMKNKEEKETGTHDALKEYKAEVTGHRHDHLFIKITDDSGFMTGAGTWGQFEDIVRELRNNARKKGWNDIKVDMFFK